MKKLFVVLVMLIALNASGQWQQDVRLTNDTGSSYPKSNWCIAANGNVVHTVWHDNRNGNDEIYYKRSTDGGINWGTDTRLTNNTSSSWYAAIAVSGMNVHTVWYDFRDGNAEIYYKRSIDGGTNWGVDTRLTNNTAFSGYPSIAVSGSIVKIVWYENRDGNGEIYFKRSSDGGITWGEDTRLTNNSAYSLNPTIAISGSNIHVVWIDERDGNYEVYYKHSTDGGINWGTDTRLSNNGAISVSTSIAVSGLLAHTVWRDNRDGNYEIYYKRSTNGGLNWEMETRLTNNNANSYEPSVAVSGSFVHLVWEETRDGNYEIYYKLSTDGGINWGADTRLTNDTELSGNPSIAVSGSIVHVAWEDNRNSNREIYYKRNPTGNVGVQIISTEIPTEYSLGQNYPNPFNPITTIKFDVVRFGDVKIVVCDVMGREVQTLVNESLKPGTYEVSFDGYALNSGVYFYKLITSGFTETKKMLLLK